MLPNMLDMGNMGNYEYAIQTPTFTASSMYDPLGTLNENSVFVASSSRFLKGTFSLTTARIDMRFPMYTDVMTIQKNHQNV